MCFNQNFVLLNLCSDYLGRKYFGLKTLSHYLQHLLLTAPSVICQIFEQRGYQALEKNMEI